MIRRRQFFTLLGGAAAWPLAARAQQPDRMRRVGVLMGVPESNSAKVWVSAFVQGLAALGWEDGRNVRVDTRWTGGDISKVKSYAAELVSLKPDVIVAAGTQGTTVLQQETTSIPIVGVQVGDLVASGLVTSLARPDGNITGFTNFEGSIGGKWVATLKEVAPGIDRVGVILNPDNIAHAGLSRTIETSSLSLGLRVTAIPVRSAAQIEVLVNAFAPGSRGALIIPPDTVILSHVNLIIALVQVSESVGPIST